MESKSSILDEFYYTDSDGKEWQIFPMKLKHASRVNKLFLKIDDQFLFLNMPTPKLDKKGNMIIDKTTKEPILDTTSYDALMELFELALHKPKEELEEIIDLQNGVQILDDFRQVGNLKKKLQEKIQEQILQNFVQS